MGRGGLLSCSSEHMAVQINFSPLCFLVKARQPPPRGRKSASSFATQSLVHRVPV